MQYPAEEATGCATVVIGARMKAVDHEGGSVSEVLETASAGTVPVPVAAMIEGSA